MRLTRIAVAAALVFAVAAYAGVGMPEPAQSQSAQEELRNTITVNGAGAVTTIPDRAEFAFGVVSEGRTAAQALNANAAEMRRVIAALREAGVAAADIQTQNVSLSPRMSNDGTAIIGYTAVNTVSARIRDIDRAGPVIDAAVAAGANQFSGPVLTRSDQTELYRSALRAAYANARSKAQALATAADVTLGRVLIASEAGGSPPVPVTERAADTGTPIEPGTQEVQANVTVTFAIQ
jgi:uncharacterized protein